MYHVDLQIFLLATRATRASEPEVLLFREPKCITDDTPRADNSKVLVYTAAYTPTG